MVQLVQPRNHTSKSDVVTLINLLYASSPSLTTYQVADQSHGFWRYEWLKQGTCIIFSNYTYFQRTLALYLVVNPDFYCE
ncbi:Ribonuclease 2, partial [Bienertia sinuspersici]